MIKECGKVFREPDTAPISAFPNINGGTYILDINSSTFMIGWALSQIQRDREYVIAYTGRR